MRDVNQYTAVRMHTSKFKQLSTYCSPGTVLMINSGWVVHLQATTRMHVRPANWLHWVS